MTYHAEMHFIYWEHRSESDTESVVVPDGCRDILLKVTPSATINVALTDWDDRTRNVKLAAGQWMCGFRLCPGLSPDSRDVSELQADKNAIAQYVTELAGMSQERVELVRHLSNPDVSIDSVAKLAGVSVRTLQRELKRQNLPRANYWRLLARARRAVGALHTTQQSLAELAFYCGYSDQAHMTRDFQRWFGATPVALRQTPMLLSEVLQPGLGNWTTEQISIR